MRKDPGGDALEYTFTVFDNEALDGEALLTPELHHAPFPAPQDPAYCRLNVTVSVDVSWLPGFAVFWIMNASREELANTYPEMILLGSAK